VAEYFQKHFVAAYQQVGSFEVVDEHGKLQRNGGNVASYFCTPEGRVVHAVTGPVAADELLDEARWAVAAYDATSADSPADVPSELARAHRLAPQPAGNRTSKSQAIHQLLAGKPLPAIRAVYREIFERILGQRVSLPGDGIEKVADAVAAAGRRQLPLLFILHKDKTNDATVAKWNNLIRQYDRNKRDPLGKLANSYVVVTLPLNLLPAVSQRLGIRPYAAPDKESPLFVVARPGGAQLTAVTTWNKTGELSRALALGLVQAAKEQPRTQEQLAQLLPLVKPVDSGLAAEVQRLLTQSKAKSGPFPARKAGREEKVALREPTGKAVEKFVADR